MENELNEIITKYFKRRAFSVSYPFVYVTDGNQSFVRKLLSEAGYGWIKIKRM